MPTDKSVVLSEDDLREIEARLAYPWIRFERDSNEGEAKHLPRGIVLSTDQRDALCQTVRALKAENKKLNQAMGWLSDAADAAYNEDADNERIHEIFNIVAKAMGITRRLPDEYQRFDESNLDHQGEVNG